MILRVENADCMDIMKEYPDAYFDLAVVDPPYGINQGKKTTIGKRAKGRIITKYIKSNYDNAIPDKKYFEELFRISKNQIIWGGNYFIEYLKNTPCVLFWSKQYIPELFSMADCEMAWTSFKSSSKMVRVKIEHNCVSNNPEKAKKYAKINQCQKPVALYEWIYKNYAKPEFKVFDSHGGSFSSLIAADNYGLSEFVICEINKDYFNDAMNRYRQFKRQLKLF